MKSSFWEKRKILLSITSYKMNPFELIKQANELKIDEIALFLTYIDRNGREKLYKELEKSSINKIPCVHLKSEMEEWELELLINKFKTEKFNIHSRVEFPLKNNLSKYNNMIYIENIDYLLDEEEIKNYAGVCADICHLERTRILFKEIHKQNLDIIKKFKVGFNHISPFIVKIEKENVEEDEYMKFTHITENLNQFDYLKNYPEEVFGPYLALEVRNDIYEQVKIKEYIQKLLSND